MGSVCSSSHARQAWRTHLPTSAGTRHVVLPATDPDAGRGHRRAGCGERKTGAGAAWQLRACLALACRRLACLASHRRQPCAAAVPPRRTRWTPPWRGAPPLWWRTACPPCSTAPRLRVGGRCGCVCGACAQGWWLECTATSLQPGRCRPAAVSVHGPTARRRRCLPPAPQPSTAGACWRRAATSS